MPAKPTFIILDNSFVQVHFLQRDIHGPFEEGFGVGVWRVTGQHEVLTQGHLFGGSVVVALEGGDVGLDQLHLLTEGHGGGVQGAGATLVGTVVALLHAVDVEGPQPLLLVDPHRAVGVFNLIRGKVNQLFIF